MPAFHRVLVTLFALTVAVALTACGGESVGSSSSETLAAPSGQPAAPQPQGPFKLGDAVQLEGLNFTVQKVEAFKSTLGASRVSVLLEVALENLGKDSVGINSLNVFRLAGPDGSTYRYSMQALAIKGATLDGRVNPGQKKVGWAGFDVPSQDGDWTLMVILPAGKAEYKFKIPQPQ